LKRKRRDGFVAMKHLAWHNGIEICRTSAGHIVLFDPRESCRDRAILVELLCEDGALDSLFLTTIEQAMATIDELVAEGLVR
jgi:hypothetical protein